MTVPHVVELSEESALDSAQVGGKVAGVAAMAREGIRVAPGFAVTASACRHCLRADGVDECIRSTLEEIDGGDAAVVEEAARSITAAIEEIALPAAVVEPIMSALARLTTRTGVKDPAMAVRSSATVEDSIGASFAGEYETFLGIRGAEDVLVNVKRCWASMFSPRAISYAKKNGIDPAEVAMAVLVQKMVPARSAGVMFTLNPVNGDRSRIVVEGAWGLGESVVSGTVTPDRYDVDKITLAPLGAEVVDKPVEYQQSGDLVPVDPAWRGEPCLSDEELVELAGMGKRLERLQGGPQDIEWAIDEELEFPDSVVLLQCRPETVWSQVQRAPRFAQGRGVTEWIASRLSPGGDKGSAGAADPSDETED